MELERNMRVVIIAHLDDEQCIEIPKHRPNERKIRFNEYLKTFPELYTEETDIESEYIDGFKMKCRFIKSIHMLSFTRETDRLIDITEPTKHQSYIDIYKHYPIDSFDLFVLSARLTYKSMSLNDWWIVYKTLITTTTVVDDNEKQIQLLCAPAFNLPLPKQLARQSACLIKFYEMFKTTLFSIYHPSPSSSLLSIASHILPAIQLAFRPEVLQWFDGRIANHKRLDKLLNTNSLCLVAHGLKKTSFKYDFSLMELQIISQFNASEWQLNTLVKRFTMKYLRCSLDNSFIRTSVLWICEIHDLENYHNIFEVWVSFILDVCRKHFLAHYFLENVNIYEKHSGLEDILKTIDYKNIDLFTEKLEENLIFPYVHQYNDRMNILIKYFQCQPILAIKMKMIYNVNIKSQFPNADSSLEEMCSILCHLSFLEDDDNENLTHFWYQQWKPLFCDFHRDDIVLQQSFIDSRPTQLAQQMTESVFKLIQMDLIQMIHLTRPNSK